MPMHADSIREAYLKASSFLRDKGVADSAANAELLLQHALGLDRTSLLLRWSEPFPAEREAVWCELLDRKAAGEPAQYIIGEQEFYGLPFTVNRNVLIPRPETELLVERMIAEGRRLWPDGSPLLADVGTGSGAIPVAIAVNCPSWRVMSSDISSGALETARGNAVRNGVSDRVELMQGDLLAPYIERGLAIDLLVSNPPYISTGDMAGLQPEVKDYEPHSALDGGVEGLDLYRRMVAQLAELKAIPRVVGFEVGQGQAREVARMLSGAADWTKIDLIADLAGIERHVVAIR
ncbi:peptide chain release factor N(5)-glutamine methyltransferase [Paenibacillus sp. MBLB4367]|uniref:peptide chain release factor N(5)-glutamine methyltransferase n=1 Tax=Paenibacillus sp. MBLB4367 TaxID=3384767 RepID=UPI00390825D2